MPRSDEGADENSKSTSCQFSSVGCFRVHSPDLARAPKSTSGRDRHAWRVGNPTAPSHTSGVMIPTNSRDLGSNPPGDPKEKSERAAGSFDAAARLQIGLQGVRASVRPTACGLLAPRHCAYLHTHDSQPAFVESKRLLFSLAPRWVPWNFWKYRSVLVTKPRAR